MMRVRGWKGLLAMMLALTGACESLTDVRGEAAPTSMRAATPASFSASIGGQVPGWMAVQVLDQYSRPIEGVPVSWTVTAGGGTVSVVNAETDAEGIARAYWTIGRRLDLTHRLRARAEGLAPVEFTAEPRFPEDHAGLYITTEGNDQTGTAGSALPQPIVVRLVTPDGGPAIAAPVIFTVPAGNGTVTPLQTSTDSTGRASATWTLGPAVGQQEVLFTVLGTGTSFRATATPAPPATVAIIRPAPNYTLPSGWSTPEVEVRDAFGNPVAGAAVVWTVTAGGGRVDTVTTHTRADGRSGNVWYAGSAPDVEQRLQAQVGSLPPVQFTTTTDAFFFRIVSPPSPGPGATVTGPTLRVDAENFPKGTHSQGQPVATFTLTVADRTVNLTEVSFAYWRGEVSLAGLAPGTYTYTLHATDVEGRTHTESVTFTYAP